MPAMDNLNRRFGRDVVQVVSHTAVSNGAETRSRSVKLERRTARHTTRLDEMQKCGADAALRFTSATKSRRVARGVPRR